MDFLFESASQIAQKADYYLKRAEIIQSNIANADTPLYKPKDLTFEKVLEEQIDLKTENEKHINPKFQSHLEYKITEDGYLTGYDGNKVNVEHELAKLAETSIMYKTLMEMMKKEFGKLKYVIQGR